MKLRTLLIAALLSASPIAANAGLINGSLTGTVGDGSVPAGWSINSVTPDTTSTAIQPFAFNVNPGDSPDGGTWVGMARNTSLAESFGQTVTEFVVGSTYNLSWYTVNTGCCAGAFSAAAEILFDLDTATAFTGATLSQGAGWLLESYSFIATSTSHRLDFKLAFGAEAYMGIDGISLSRASSVPEPGTLTLLGVSLLGFCITRRRRRTA